MAAHSADEIYEALLALRDTGTTVEAVRAQPGLIGLRYVERAATTDKHPEPTPDQLAVVARREIDDAAKAIGRDASGALPWRQDEVAAARLILGTKSSLPLHTRRGDAADALGMRLDTMLHRRPGKRTHEERVIEHVADVMWERETECILGLVFAEMKRASPEASDLAADLLHRFQHYYRVWNVLDGLRADVAAVLQIRRHGEARVNELDDYVRSSPHWYARFQQLVRGFVDEYGGMWIFWDKDIEQSVSDAIKLVENFSRMTYRQDSELRVLANKHEELDPFLRRLEAKRQGQDLVEAWRRHLYECDCDLEHPKEDCNVHLLMAACQYYIDAIDTDWYSVAPWYRGMSKYRKIVDPATLYEAVGLAAQMP